MGNRDSQHPIMRFSGVGSESSDTVESAHSERYLTHFLSWYRRPDLPEGTSLNGTFTENGMTTGFAGTARQYTLHPTVLRDASAHPLVNQPRTRRSHICNVFPRRMSWTVEKKIKCEKCGKVFVVTGPDTCTSGAVTERPQPGSYVRALVSLGTFPNRTRTT